MIRQTDKKCGCRHRVCSRSSSVHPCGRVSCGRRNKNKSASVSPWGEGCNSSVKFAEPQRYWAPERVRDRWSPPNRPQGSVPNRQEGVHSCASSTNTYLSRKQTRDGGGFFCEHTMCLSKTSLKRKTTGLCFRPRGKCAATPQQPHVWSLRGLRCISRRQGSPYERPVSKGARRS